MNTRRLLIASFVFLATGVYLLFAFCHGTTGLQAGDTLSSNSIKIDMTTTGYPEIAGVPLTLIGSLLLMISFVAAIVGEIRSFRKKKEPAAVADSPDPVRP
jgi:hypothetical protein